MTGWGSNFWIIDRKTGKAYEFPYKTNYLRFKKESNLLIMDPKETILKNLKELHDFHNACVYQYSVSGQMFTDLRPFYFIWKNNKLQMLAGPPGEKPLSNSFWKDFFWKPIAVSINYKTFSHDTLFYFSNFCSLLILGLRQ